MLLKLFFRSRRSLIGAVSVDRDVYWRTDSAAKLFGCKSVDNTGRNLYYLACKKSSESFNDILPQHLRECYTDFALEEKLIRNSILITYVSKSKNKRNAEEFAHLETLDFCVREGDPGLYKILKVCSESDPGAVPFRLWLDTCDLHRKPTYSPRSPSYTPTSPQPPINSPTSSSPSLDCPILSPVCSSPSGLSLFRPSAPDYPLPPTLFPVGRSPDFSLPPANTRILSLNKKEKRRSSI